MRQRLKSKIAFRYLISKKSHSVVNLISVVSMIAIAVPTAAVVILFSVHNGFERFIEGLWSTLNPSIVIERSADNERYFDIDSVNVDSIKSVGGVENISFYIEDKALFKYKGRQLVGRVRGVDKNYDKITPIRNVIVQGRYDLSNKQSLIGMGVAYSLGLKINLSEPFSICYPSRKRFTPLNPSSFYTEIKSRADAVFTVDATNDTDLVFVDLKQGQKLYSRSNQATAIGVLVNDEVSIKKVKQDLQDVVGYQYVVKDKYEQNIDEYKLIKSEKFAIYLIILLVLIVASFTLIGAVVMLMLEKKGNIKPLFVAGATDSDVRDIFIWQGFSLSFIGAIMGVIIGVGISLAQQYGGFVKIAGDASLIDTYPILVRVEDIAIVLVSVVLFSYLIVLITTRLVLNKL